MQSGSVLSEDLWCASCSGGRTWPGGRRGRSHSFDASSVSVREQGQHQGAQAPSASEALREAPRLKDDLPSEGFFVTLIPFCGLGFSLQFYWGN